MLQKHLPIILFQMMRCAGAPAGQIHLLILEDIVQDGAAGARALAPPQLLCELCSRRMFSRLAYGHPSHM